MRVHLSYWLLALATASFSGCAQPALPPIAEWEGTWEAADSHGGELRCDLRPIQGDQWEAKFTGLCDRQFAYEVTMKGRRDGDAIRFTGEADLGEKDGGLFQWTGQVVGQEFVGAYESTSGKTGKFQMKPAAK